MNAPLCRSCRRPLRPDDAFCQGCGTPVAAPPSGNATAPGRMASGQSASGPTAPKPLPYGAIPHGDPFAGLGSAQRAAPRGRHGQGAPANSPTGTPPGRRSGNVGMIAGLLAAIVIVAGVGITALVVGTGGDQGDDEAYEPSPTSQGSNDPDTTPGQTTPSPSGSSTAPSKVFTRMPPTGTDKEQIRQLAVDWAEWLDSIYAGDVGACDYMDLYIVKVPKKSLISCRRSAATPLPDGDTITTKPGKITVNGNKGTVTIKYEYEFDGKPNHTSTEADVVKKNGTWYFAEV